MFLEGLCHGFVGQISFYFFLSLFIMIECYCIHVCAILLLLL